MAEAAGIVYYLHGENNDLSYEKFCTSSGYAPSGLIEHKHYLSAGGIIFAMQISRAGNLAATSPAKPCNTCTMIT